ncbi:helix-hairpin-helix domain-containing protein [Gammaproteobacteria bacterium]|nr:helix-hairpin-helix domain-containing protein [Gammaproteobacteria bacterium]
MTTALTKISGIGPSTAKVLTENGFNSARQLADTTIAQLSRVPGFSTARASRTIQAANALLAVSADASAITTTKAHTTQTTIQQRRVAKIPAPEATRSVSVAGTEVAADTKQPEVGDMAEKAQKAEKKAEKATKKAVKKAKKVEKAAKKAAEKAAKKAAKKAKKAKKAAKKAKKAKAKKKTKSKKNKK